MHVCLCIIYIKYVLATNSYYFGLIQLKCHFEMNSTETQNVHFTLISLIYRYCFKSLFPDCVCQGQFYKKTIFISFGINRFRNSVLSTKCNASQCFCSLIISTINNCSHVVQLCVSQHMLRVLR